MYCATTKYLLTSKASSSSLVHDFSWPYGSSKGEIELQEIMNDLIHTQMYNSLRILIALIFITIVGHISLYREGFAGLLI